MTTLIKLSEISKALGYRTNRVLNSIHGHIKVEHAQKQGKATFLPLAVLCDAIQSDPTMRALKRYKVLYAALKQFFDHKGFGLTMDDVLRQIMFIVKQYTSATKVAQTMNNTYAEKAYLAYEPVEYKTRDGVLKKTKGFKLGYWEGITKTETILNQLIN